MGGATKKQSSSSKKETQKLERREKKARLAKVAILKQKLQCQSAKKGVGMMVGTHRIIRLSASS